MNVKRCFFLIILVVLFSNSIYAQEYGKQYEKCSERLKNVNDDSIYILRLLEKDSCLIGVTAPNFKASTINGHTIELHKLKGQVVFLNFWGTGCGPCVEEIPGFNKLVSHYAGKKVKFIAIGSDKVPDLKKFLKTIPFNFLQIAESEKIYEEVFKLSEGIPYAIIIDKFGKIYKMCLGSAGDLSFSFYENLIDNCLSGKQ